MHEAKALRIESLIEDGDGHKIKWGEMLQEFTSLDLPRMLIAAEKLSPSRLDSLIDVCNRAKGESKKRAFKSIELKMLELNIDPKEFTDYMVSAPKEKERAQKNPVIDQQTRAAIVELIKVEIPKEGYKLSEVRKKLEKLGYPVTPVNIYQLRDRAVKEIGDAKTQAA